MAITEWGPGELEKLTPISWIYPLAATNAKVAQETNLLQQQWVSAAPHHLAWFDGQANKAAASVENLKHVQLTDLNVFGPSQVGFALVSKHS